MATNLAIACKGYQSKQAYMHALKTCPDCGSTALNVESNGRGSPRLRCVTCLNLAAEKRRRAKGVKKQGFNKSAYMRKHGCCPDCNSKEVKQYPDRSWGGIKVECLCCLRRKKRKDSTREYQSKQSYMRENKCCPDCGNLKLSSGTRKGGKLIYSCAPCKSKKWREKYPYKEVKATKQDYMRLHGACPVCNSDKLVVIRANGPENKGRLYACTACAGSAYKANQIAVIGDSYLRHLIKAQMKCTSQEATTLMLNHEVVNTKRAMVEFKRELKKWKEVSNG